MEIIPNWHPIFVHFTVALLSISTMLFLASLILPPKLKEQAVIVGKCNLWLGCLMTVGTVSAGLYAYYTVAHDAPSHAAMTDHRNWAFITAGLFTVTGLWSLWEHSKSKNVSIPFLILLVIATGFLGITGFKGGELVYRHGMGVMSMPEVHGDGGHDTHDHGDTGHEETPELKTKDDHQDHGSHDH